ncbi:hypothetical protein DFS34DRAFT_653211 [Phlyctochytrium arcticum]|nr:hypothetical protein DFS34DRAFT_653211 [Phlyctochytrium arcticum]
MSTSSQPLALFDQSRGGGGALHQLNRRPILPATHVLHLGPSAPNPYILAITIPVIRPVIGIDFGQRFQAVAVRDGVASESGFGSSARGQYRSPSAEPRESPSEHHEDAGAAVAAHRNHKRQLRGQNDALATGARMLIRTHSAKAETKLLGSRIIADAVTYIRRSGYEFIQLGIDEVHLALCWDATRVFAHMRSHDEETAQQGRHLLCIMDLSIVNSNLSGEQGPICPQIDPAVREDALKSLKRYPELADVAEAVFESRKLLRYLQPENFRDGRVYVAYVSDALVTITSVTPTLRADAIFWILDSAEQMFDLRPSTLEKLCTPDCEW